MKITPTLLPSLDTLWATVTVSIHQGPNVSALLKNTWCLQGSLTKPQLQKKKKIWVTFPKRKRRAVMLLTSQLLITSTSWGCLVPCSVHCVVCWRLEFNSMSHPLDFWRVFWGILVLFSQTETHNKGILFWRLENKTMIAILECIQNAVEKEFQQPLYEKRSRQKN